MCKGVKTPMKKEMKKVKEGIEGATRTIGRGVSKVREAVKETNRLSDMKQLKKKY